jgi:hypothetical protein
MLRLAARSGLEAYFGALGNVWCARQLCNSTVWHLIRGPDGHAETQHPVQHHNRAPQQST